MKFQKKCSRHSPPVPLPRGAQIEHVKDDATTIGGNKILFYCKTYSHFSHFIVFPSVLCFIIFSFSYLFTGSGTSAIDEQMFDFSIVSSITSNSTAHTKAESMVNKKHQGKNCPLILVLLPSSAKMKINTILFF